MILTGSLGKTVTDRAIQYKIKLVSFRFPPVVTLDQ